VSLASVTEQVVPKVIFDSQAAREFGDGFVFPLKFCRVPFKINPLPIAFIQYQCTSGCMEATFPMFKHSLHLHNYLRGWGIVCAGVNQIGIINVCVARKVVGFFREEIQ
jgi:hypothetical protein